MSDQARPDSHTDTEPRHSPWLVLVVLCLGFFMILLDTTIVNVAIPAMSDSLNASLADVLWILNAYILVYAEQLIVFRVLQGLGGALLTPQTLSVLAASPASRRSPSAWAS